MLLNSKLLLGAACALFALQGCNYGLKKTDGKAAETDLAKLEEESKSRCPAGAKLTKSQREVALMVDAMPNPIVFAFQKGAGRCADWTGVDHDGIDSWLKVTNDPDCVANGSLWEIDRVSLYEGIKVDFILRPIDRNDTSKVTIFTARGYKFSALREKLGLETFICN